jgi:hypothetical protein
MASLAPNPYSPYADADPKTRHIFASPIFFGLPDPGVLAPTACEAMAVVPEEQLTTTGPDAELPEGLCQICVNVMQGGEAPARPVSNCRECECFTDHDGLCAVCRQEKHEEWWPTRAGEQSAVEASEICGKCKQPFDPADTRFDGRARYHLTPYCRGCVSRCHDTEIADHRCVICA